MSGSREYPWIHPPIYMSLLSWAMTVVSCHGRWVSSGKFRVVASRLRHRCWCRSNRVWPGQHRLRGVYHQGVIVGATMMPMLMWQSAVMPVMGVAARCRSSRCRRRGPNDDVVSRRWPRTSAPWHRQRSGPLIPQ